MFIRQGAGRWCWRCMHTASKQIAVLQRCLCAPCVCRRTRGLPISFLGILRRLSSRRVLLLDTEKCQTIDPDRALFRVAFNVRSRLTARSAHEPEASSSVQVVIAVALRECRPSLVFP
jgi:hypothetical protein